ncbi:unnamed protein product [Urochloa humidicola]
MSRRRRRQPSLPDGDVLLWEILLRLPPLPSSLPRVSLVCKRWHRLVTDPSFLRRFIAHHRHTPPLLGFFQPSTGSFFPALNPPDRIPAARFSMPLQSNVLWNPVTGSNHLILETIFYSLCVNR